MRLLFRLLMTVVAGVFALFVVFVLRITSALLFTFRAPRWLSFVTSLGAAGLISRYTWLNTASFQPGLFASIVLGATVAGGVGFAAGFFGPIIFAPGANQGPLLGIFFTGPIGFLLGGVGGGIYWLGRGRRRTKFGSSSDG